MNRDGFFLLSDKLDVAKLADAAEAFAAHAAHRRVRQAQRVTHPRLFAVNQALAEWGLHELQMAWLLQML